MSMVGSLPKVGQIYEANNSIMKSPSNMSELKTLDVVGDDEDRYCLVFYVKLTNSNPFFISLRDLKSFWKLKR